MRVQVLSDLHLEFHKDRGADFIARLDPHDVDVLVLAGDITVATMLRDTVKRICRKYARAAVIYVPGNHEYYDASWDDVVTALGLARDEVGNLHPLDGESVVLDGVRFVGATLWFKNAEDSGRYEAELNDFYCIRRFKSWVYKTNERHAAYLAGSIVPGDVVVTHHAPSIRSIAPEFADSELNRFYVTDMAPTIVQQQPALWVHGHMHHSFDYTLGKTRIVCNPYGYANHALNKEFNLQFIIEV